MRILALLLLGAGVFCLMVKLPHYALSCGVLSLTALLMGKEIRSWVDKQE